MGAHKPKNVVPGKARMLGLLSHQILPVASCTCTHTLHQISTLSPSPFLQNNDFPCFEGFVCVGEKMWSPGRQGSRDPILSKFCQPLAIRTYNLSTKFQPFPPTLSCTTRISNMLRVYIYVCVREENVVPWKSKKPRPDSHQNLSVARFSFTHTLQKISTLSPSPILHYEGFKCVEGSM